MNIIKNNYTKLRKNKVFIIYKWTMIVCASYTGTYGFFDYISNKVNNNEDINPFELMCNTVTFTTAGGLFPIVGPIILPILIVNSIIKE